MFVSRVGAFVELMVRGVQKRTQRVIMRLVFANVVQKRINGVDPSRDVFLDRFAFYGVIRENAETQIV